MPALGSTLFRKGVKTKRQREGLGVISKEYRRILKWSLNHKWIVIVISIVILIGSIGLGATTLGTSYISSGDNKFLALTYTPKPGETEKSFKSCEGSTKMQIVKIKSSNRTIFCWRTDTSRSNR